MLVGHIADAHLGKRQYNLDERENDVYEAFREACTLLRDRGIEVLLLSGDIFDVSRPPIRALKEFRDAVTPLIEEGVKVYAISGDHDTPKRRDVPPLMLFDSMGVTYLWSRKPCTEGEPRICGLQNFPRGGRQALLDLLGKMSPGEPPSILMLHQGLKPYFRFGELEAELLPRGFTYYALGHVHTYMVKRLDGGLLVYPGSLDVMDVKEVGDAAKGRKGPVLVEIEGSHVRAEKLPLQSLRPQVVVRMEEGGDLIEKIAEALERTRPHRKKPLVHIYLYELPPRETEEKILRELGGQVLKIIYHRVPRGGEELIRREEAQLDLRQILGEVLKDERLVDLAEELLEVLGRQGDSKRGYSLILQYFEEVAGSDSAQG